MKQDNKSYPIAKLKFIDFSEKNPHRKASISRFFKLEESDTTIEEKFKRSHYISGFYELLISLDNSLNINRKKI